MDENIATAPQSDVSTAAPAEDVADVASEGQEFDVDDVAKVLDDEEEQEQQPAEESQQPEQQQAQPEQIAPPVSWSKADQEIFNSLPDNAKQIIARRERERDGFLSMKAQETAQARHDHDALMQYAQQAIENALAQAEMAIEGDFYGIDREELAISNPELAIKINALYSQRERKLADAMQRLNELREYHQQVYKQREQSFIQEQAKGLTEKIGSIVGEGFAPKEWKQQAINYLSSLGVPKEHINGITHSYQVELIAKAMKYDEMKNAASKAKQMVPEAPNVMKTTRTAAEENNAKKAWKAFKNNPDSTDALASVLDSM